MTIETFDARLCRVKRQYSFASKEAAALSLQEANKARDEAHAAYWRAQEAHTAAEAAMRAAEQRYQSAFTDVIIVDHLKQTTPNIK